MLRSLVVALVGALVCVWLRTPLPWLIGPLVAVAVVSMLHGRLESPPAGRHIGQWIIGVALGLYFSPDVVREVGRLGVWVGLAVAFALALGLLGSWMLSTMVETDSATSFFGMAIGGASEMAVLAERHGGQVERVAAAHSLRIMLVVLIVPLLLNAFDVHGRDPYVPTAREFSWGGFALLAAVTGGAALVMGRLGSPNSWMIGPLLAAAAVTAFGATWSSLPVPVVNAGQLLIGIGLGTRFTPEFFESAPRFLGAVAAITLVYLAVAAAFGWLLALGSGLHWSTAIVATTPGGIGEMALTAQALRLGVPIVTAFHAIRMAVVVMTVGVTYRAWRRWNKEQANDA
ncbi:MAG TPA: AbrB family transcriptional regulator [Burkholderiaceae bacterium]|nr:AbrB family transcriptional regulator [Burkholderiaceae bacterium]